MHLPGPVLHVPYTFAPDPVGGTEVYVDRLARAQRARGVEAVVVAPRRGPPRTYDHHGVRVRRFPCAEAPSLEALWGEGDPEAAASFIRILDEERPCLVHLHSFTSAVSPLVVGALVARRVPIVLTYHTATISCPRGTLLRWGSVPCDGELRTGRCTACVLEGKGLPRPAALATSVASRLLGRAARAVGGRGSATTALRMHELVGRRHAATRTLFDRVDRIIVLCEWTSAVLRANRVDPAKIRRIRHGVVAEAGSSPGVVPADGPPLRLAFVGRLVPEKGPDMLLRALEQVTTPVQLDLFGLPEGGASDRFTARLRAAAARDARVRLLPPIPHGDVIRRVNEYHALTVPSRGFETGPFVVLEAFAAGVPVLGSRLGGIEEWVTDGVDGLLLPVDDAKAWGRAFERLGGSPALLRSLREGVHAPPPFDAPPDQRSVVAQVEQVYREVLDSR